MKYGKQLAGLASVLAATGAMALTALPGASAAQAHTRPAASGTEHFRLLTGGEDTNGAPVIATGLFTAGGRDHVVSNSTDKFVFPNGTITVKHVNGKGSQSFSTRTCLARISGPGTYRLVRGTGAYAGITGHGRFRLNILIVAARNGSGKCSKKMAPAAAQLEIQASGPASL